MSFFGMGPLEIFFVLLIAFIFLGPERMVDTARWMGKAVREVRRMAAELPSLTEEDFRLNPITRNTKEKVNANKVIKAEDAAANADGGNEVKAEDGTSIEEEGPVQFNSTDASTKVDAASEKPTKEERA